jgi:UDP-N-acetylglucosamine 2-epimerase (non-hydrolysing)
MNNPGSIVVFAGTRPEIIKMAPVVRELRRRRKELPNALWQVHFCYSGQHTELAIPFLEYFDIAPDSTLDLMSAGQSLGELAARALAQLDQFLHAHNALAALVQGDTTTALAATLCGFYHHVPIGHVEAGLRTSDVYEPFPEEMNRRLIGQIASWHYAPTAGARDSLIREGRATDTILVTGNTGIDALKLAIDRAIPPVNPRLASLSGRRLVLITAHRRENIGAPLEAIAGAISELAGSFPAVHFVLPVHRNPAVAQILTNRLEGIGNVHLMEPLPYHELVWVMKSCELILSDSGGIQEEAPTLRKPVLVLRNETERPEAVDYGTSIIVGSSQPRIVTVAAEFLRRQRTIQIKNGPNPYGDGNAAIRIVDDLFRRLSLGNGS